MKHWNFKTLNYMLRGEEPKATPTKDKRVDQDRHLFRTMSLIVS